MQNATIWTGSKEGHEIIKGDILLDGGIIKGLGDIDNAVLQSLSIKDAVKIDAQGAWISPG